MKETQYWPNAFVKTRNVHAKERPMRYCINITVFSSGHKYLIGASLRIRHVLIHPIALPHFLR